VQKDYARRAAPRRLFVLVRPAPVIGQCARAEKVGLVGGCGRIVHEHDQNLIAIIRGRALVIIPALLRCVDAVTDKDQIGVHRDVLGLRSREGDEILRELEALFFIAARDGEHRLRVGIDTHERDGLKETAIRSASFKAQRLELRRYIFGGQLAAARSRSASFEQVVGKIFDMSAQRILADTAAGRCPALGPGCWRASRRPAATTLRPHAARQAHDEQSRDDEVPFSDHLFSARAQPSVCRIHGDS
jgi:hypothetical protein